MRGTDVHQEGLFSYPHYRWCRQFDVAQQRATAFTRIKLNYYQTNAKNCYRNR